MPPTWQLYAPMGLTLLSAYFLSMTAMALVPFSVGSILMGLYLGRTFR
jgi:hypothetical protein